MGCRHAQDVAAGLLRPAQAAARHALASPSLFKPSRSATRLPRRASRDCILLAANAFANRRHYATGPDSPEIGVLGGGLTGLTTAYYLSKHMPKARITLFEASSRLGGWVKTDKVRVDVSGVQGTVAFERGPRSVSSLSGTTVRFDDLVLYDLVLDLGLQTVDVPSMPRYFYYPDHLVPLPPSTTILRMLQEPAFLALIPAFLALIYRIMTKNFPSGEEDVSVAEWVRQFSYGDALGDILTSAMLHGIHGGDIDKLSARQVLDTVYWQYHESVLRKDKPALSELVSLNDAKILQTLGQDKQIQRLALQPKGPLLHFGQGGMETLTTALADALKEQPNVDIRLEEPVRTISYARDARKVKVASSKGKRATAPKAFDKVISTLTAQRLSKTIGDKIPALAEAHSVSIMTVNLWYPLKDLKPPGFGYLIPRAVPAEQNPERALGVFFDSDVQVGCPDEPEGTKLFVLMGGHYYDSTTPPSEEEAIAQAKSLLERHLGIPRDTPCFATAQLARECIPQHYVGHQDRMCKLDGALLTDFGGRLAVAGGSYTRIGAMGALRAGYEVAAQVAAGEDGMHATGLESFGTPGNYEYQRVDDIPVRRLKGQRPRS